MDNDFIKEIHDEIDVKKYSPLAFAYIGDAVFELYVRNRELKKFNTNTSTYHESTVKHVKSEAQSRKYFAIEDKLTQDEIKIFKRGRNAKSNSIPKNADVKEYKTATGFETLLGYLYLKGNFDRLKEIMDMAYME